MMDRWVPVGRRGSFRLTAAVAALAFVACACSGDGPERSTGPADAALAPRTTAAPPLAATPPATVFGVDAEAPDPVRVQAEAIGVDAPIIALGLDASGALEVPDDVDETGWWTGGPEPGEQGSAIIAGHVDSRRGPAVFYRLGELAPGDVVNVVRADGTRVEFTVQRIEQHAKTAFPTDSVYAPTAGVELRLITCGGAFDRSSGHYVDNLIVFAVRT